MASRTAPIWSILCSDTANGFTWTLLSCFAQARSHEGQERLISRDDLPVGIQHHHHARHRVKRLGEQRSALHNRRLSSNFLCGIATCWSEKVVGRVQGTSPEMTASQVVVSMGISRLQDAVWRMGKYRLENPPFPPLNVASAPSIRVRIVATETIAGTIGRWEPT